MRKKHRRFPVLILVLLLAAAAAVYILHTENTEKTGSESQDSSLPVTEENVLPEETDADAPETAEDSSAEQDDLSSAVSADPETTESEESTPEESLAEAVSAEPEADGIAQAESIVSEDSVTLDQIPEYTSEPYVEINGNMPFFTEDDYSVTPFEEYSELDSLGRCGTAYANICLELMPTEERGEIGSIKPSGWHLYRYDFISDLYLYNRCHLIGYQLAGENANEKNLITGTRYLNVTGMLPFENMVDNFVEETGFHVLYRVTPIFEEDNLVASGVLMEAKSVEDHGTGICFCVYVYNVQPGVVIDYATGESSADESYVFPEEPETESTETETAEETDTEDTYSPPDCKYVLNTNSMRFHYPECSAVESMAEHNMQLFNGTREDAIAMGYSPCGICQP